MSSPICNLSTELLLKIFSFVDVKERLKLEQGKIDKINCINIININFEF